MKKNIFFLLILFTSMINFGQVNTYPNISYDFSQIVAIAPALQPTNGLVDPGLPIILSYDVTGTNFSCHIANGTQPPVGSMISGEFVYANQPIGASNNNNDYNALSGQINPNIYYEVTLNPVLLPNNDGFLQVIEMWFDAQRSTDGVRSFAVRCSRDNYQENLMITSNGNTTIPTPDNAFFFTTDDNSQANTYSLQNNVSLQNINSSWNIDKFVTFRFYGYNAENANGTFGIDNVNIGTYTIYLNTTQNEISNLKIYPNPVTSNILNIETALNASKSIIVFDVLGKQVLNVTTESTTVNVGNLNPGIYMVKITEEGKIATRKLVIR